jgi:phenylalanyl-tRNA synthetase beta chain
MKVSYNWLKEFVDFKLSPEDLAHKLTMTGLEVEEIEKLDDDTVIDIGVTPNRPDCLSIRGIAREISAILELPLKDVTVKIDNEAGQGPVVEIESPELCPRYTARIITGVKTGPSPEWLSKRLDSCGIRPTSNIVDVTNYILLELGQPMHAFDLDNLAGGKIVVKQAKGISSFTTLDDEERKISEDMLLIWDAEKPVAVAGVMGGLDSEVSKSSVNILLESAYFHPSSIRRTSKALNLSSEAAYRFERGVDKEAVALAMDRAAQMIQEIAGGEVSGMTDNYPLPYEPVTTSVSFNKINSVIGVDINESFVEETLIRIGCKTAREGDSLSVVPPSFRDDIRRDIDIVEEIARMYGYDNIPSTFPLMQMSAAPVHEQQELVNKLKNSMVKAGFSEAINYSFINPDSLDKLLLPDADRRRSLIYVKNPLRKEESAMRTTLIPGLLNNINTNTKRGEKMIRLFEISRVFLESGEKLPNEIVQIGAVYHKEQATALWQSRHDGFYDLKGVFENICTELRINNAAFTIDTTSAAPYLHPAKSCAIIIDGKKIGVIGKLHPAVSEAFDINGDITIAEIYDINDILNSIPACTTFKPLPKFPYVERDMALIVSNDINVNAVTDEINSIDSDIIESVRMFDIYTGKSIEDDKKSLAFSIRYRSAEKTLTDSEVDELHGSIIDRLQNTLKAELRG